MGCSTGELLYSHTGDHCPSSQLLLAGSVSSSRAFFTPKLPCLYLEAKSTTYGSGVLLTEVGWLFQQQGVGVGNLSITSVFEGHPKGQILCRGDCCTAKLASFS